ncbi:MAG TPA: methionyl-tRNA formyltransferase [Rhodospirillales bacterium]|nr:methionyl-tRNA formyltransferase [Rhodospirillales bacterium]
MKKTTLNYVVASIKSWNIETFHRRIPSLPGQWHLIDDRDDLTVERLKKLNPRYVFFPHWSWKVPDEILKAAECVAFHMTDLPYGRGGSPLQNLILSGHKTTQLSAILMTDEIDAGPVYMKRPLSLDGKAQDIYERMADLVYDMIDEIITKEPQPVSQQGEPTFFNRRSPDQSLLPADGNIHELYDHIRMLDAETYPRAFLRNGKTNLEFSEARLLGDGTLRAVVKITPHKEDVT